MFRILLLAALLLGGGVLAARLIDQFGRAPASATAKTAAPAPSAAQNSRSLVIKAGTGGHFEVEARVDGRRIQFIVDTGASHIALRESDAARLGIRPTPRDYMSRSIPPTGSAVRHSCNYARSSSATSWCATFPPWYRPTMRSA